MKVLKVAAIVVGATILVATGIGVAAGLSAGLAFSAAAETVVGLVGISGAAATAIAAASVGVALMTAAGALMPKPSGGGEQTKWKADPYAGIPYCMGRTLTSGNIVARIGYGENNKFNLFVTILSLGPIHSIETSFIDKTTVAYSGGAATGTYNGQIWQVSQRGACPEPAALVPPVAGAPGWTSAHKLSGLAAVMNVFAYDAKSKKTLTTIPQPAHIIEGVLVYDPRLDSTYPGGSGPCRAYDESTYVYSENPELHALTWAIGRYQNGKRVAGIGTGNTVPAGAVRGVDVASFVEGANLSDARGWKVGGTIYTRPDTLWNSLKAMCQAGGSQPALIGGVIHCLPRAPKVSLATITRDDIVGKATFAGTQQRRSRINGIIPQYRSEAHDWEMVSAGAVFVDDFVTLDGDERTKEIPYPLVQDVTQASQLAVLDIYDAREAGPGTVPLKPKWLDYRIGDAVTFAPEDDFSILTTISGWALDAQSGAVTLTLRGETDGKHAYALGTSGTAPPVASFTYDPTIAAPTGDWALAGTTLTANGGSIPALVLTGAVSNPSADAIAVAWRVHVDGAGEEDGWISEMLKAPTVTRVEITGVTPGTAYDVSVRNRVRGVLGDRAIFGPETSGDFTAQQVAVSLDPVRTFPADASGAVTSGLLPATVVPQVLRAGVDIRASDAVAYSVASSGVTATVNSANGDAGKGTITITAIDSLNGWVDLTVTVDGIAWPAQRMVVQKSVGLPASLGGVGSKVAADNDFIALDGTSDVAITDVLTLTLASGESFYASAPLEYFVISETLMQRRATLVWQYSPAGAGIWTDMGPPVTGSYANNPIGNSGYIGCTQSVGGLPAGDYNLRLVGHLSGPGQTVAFSGTATVTAKI